MLPDWPRAWGGPSGQAILRGSNSDFLVEEQLDLVPSDDGEFDWLWIEKSGDSTEFVAKALARHADVAIKAVGYSGLKDRHALTRQWFWETGRLRQRSVPKRSMTTRTDTSEPRANRDWQETSSYPASLLF